MTMIMYKTYQRLLYSYGYVWLGSAEIVKKTLVLTKYVKCKATTTNLV
jgi:hypothetical protein